MTSIAQVHSLPFDVIGHVLNFIPPWKTDIIGTKRHDVANILLHAHKNDKLCLVYLRKINFRQGRYNTEVYNSLAPSVTGTNVYGDDDAPMQIQRTKISIGEKLRMKVKMKTYKQ